MSVSNGTRMRTQHTHSVDVRQQYERVLAGAPVRSRFIGVGEGTVHLLEKGGGRPLVLLPGGASLAAFFLPLLDELDGVRALAPDRPGQGLSDPVDLGRDRFRETAVAWVDDLLGALDLGTTALLGHSGGAVWALWYALAHPDRVSRLVLVAPPALPNVRCPLPLRVVGTPGLGSLLSRLVPPTPKSLLRFAGVMGEGATLAGYPEFLDLWVATGRDPIADRAAQDEHRALLSPFALVTRSAFRRGTRVRTDDLRRLAVPTLLVWGERDPLANTSIARALAELIPDARLRTLPTGHMPWLGQPARAAAAVADFLR